MKWLLQKNIWAEYDYDRFITSIIDAEQEYEEVNVIPFTDNFEHPIDFVPTQVFGSGRFVNICREKGFRTFKSFDPYEPFYPSFDWINGDGVDITWGEFKGRDISEPVFIKPYTEKFFTGKVVDSNDDKEKIQLSTSFIANEDDEIIRMSSFVNIYYEVRFFVIGGQIVTGSLYKKHGIGTYFNIDRSFGAWQQCENILSSGFIDDAFVIDLGCTTNGGDFCNRPAHDWKIVELNNINSSGIYKCDTDAIVRAFQYL